MLVKDLLRGRARVVEPLLDIVSLPLAFECFSWSCWHCLSRPAGCGHTRCAPLRRLGCMWPRRLHKSGDWRGSLRALARTPGYIAWKIAMIPGILRNSREGSAWIRTQRDVSSSEVL